MPILPLNREVKRRLRAGHAFRLHAVPAGMAFLPLLVQPLLYPQIDDYIARQSSLGHGVEARMMVNLLLYGSMFACYALGWLISAAGARWVLRWPADKVRAVYLRSEVPEHWIDPDTPPPRTPDEVMRDTWAPFHVRGARHFVLTRGVLAFGGIMFSMGYLIPTAIGVWWQWSLGATAVAAGLAVGVGAALGIVLWLWSERRYRKLPARRSA